MTDAKVVICQSPADAPAWQQELSRAITVPAELCRFLGLDPNLAAHGVKFKLRVPKGFVARMRYGDPNDPLLRQVLPVSAEMATREHCGADPLNEHAALTAPGLLQKYIGRALLVTTGACAVHCR
jgi:L-lysine 2,3-aminomutase